MIDLEHIIHTNVKLNYYYKDQQVILQLMHNEINYK